jgi:hypothetical protein
MSLLWQCGVNVNQMVTCDDDDQANSRWLGRLALDINFEVNSYTIKRNRFP